MFLFLVGLLLILSSTCPTNTIFLTPFPFLYLGRDLKKLLLLPSFHFYGQLRTSFETSLGVSYNIVCIFLCILCDWTIQQLFCEWEMIHTFQTDIQTPLLYPRTYCKSVDLSWKSNYPYPSRYTPLFILFPMLSYYIPYVIVLLYHIGVFNLWSS